ncbi:hypothetical protein MMC07_002399 [Pseudocyphellaria aurata]|nr:hypothetical protein [Pseudocyphellaria aurata]
MSIETNATIASFGGKLFKVAHNASTTKCKMNFNLYVPPQASRDPLIKVPLLIYLAGLTCTGDNGAEKGFFQRAASELGIAMLYPDTSPRGLKIQDEDKDWDFGTGAGFYVDATEDPWSEGYKMYSYITQELPDTVFKNFPEIDAGKVSITGHSMGGHGALTLFLKNPSKYKSVSAFAPIANPSACPWGQKAFSGYLGTDDKAKWADHDATELVKKWNGGKVEILIDVGTDDPFYVKKQLLPENFKRAADNVRTEASAPVAVQLRMQEGYDHSYFFISSFAEDHVRHAAKFLR